MSPNRMWFMLLLVHTTFSIKAETLLDLRRDMKRERDGYSIGDLETVIE